MEEQLLGYEGEMYRLDREEHIAGRLDRALRILRTRKNLMTRSSEHIRPYLRRAGFEYAAYIVEFEHDWPLASALIERIDGDPVSGCIVTDEVDCEARLVPQQDLWRAGAGCQERLMRYTRGYIMQLIGDFLFPEASDSRVHIRWLPLLEDLDTCGQLSWDSAVLAWLYRQMCQATEHDQCNLGGFSTSWTNARGESRLRHYRRTLNGIEILNVEWTPYADPPPYADPRRKPYVIVIAQTVPN
ncbi:hypothetical protein Ahy_A09g045331 [Arachis hypogaea]|uniref:Aminotransferase-like plant mobile domain-containing protein n=1 Tax=Arachis hypogaea TaxID=3818 RepID=A0A445BM54_ARAHY|nr:hypothetical protein Ahy_A09g045331 [Arachis hypogaea]